MKKLFFTTVIALLFLACSKDDDGASSGTSNKFTYLDETTILNNGEYLEADDDLYLYLSNSETINNYVVVVFHDRTFETLPSNTYNLNDPGPNIEEDTSFDIAYITTEESPLGDNATEGEVTITRNEGNSLKISFELTTANGTAIGQYEGEFSER